MSASTFLLYVAPLVLLAVGAVVFWWTGRETDHHHGPAE